MKVCGVVVGKVVDRNELGKVLVTYPWLGGDPQGYWAPVATTMSGGGRGTWFMPEVGDDVLVAFDHGDVDQPYVIGFLWNGQQKPPGLDPGTDADPQRRLIMSVNQHMIEIYDPDVGGDGEAGYIRLRDAYGSEVVMQNSEVRITAKGSLTLEGDNITINGRLVTPIPSTI